jgi:hypothetical protein
MSASVLPVYDAYMQVHGRLVDIDQRIMGLPEDADLWLELDAALAELRNLVTSLIVTPAVTLVELRAKATVLATLLRSEDDERVGRHSERALALAIADDLVGYQTNLTESA